MASQCNKKGMTEQNKSLFSPLTTLKRYYKCYFKTYFVKFLSLKKKKKQFKKSSPLICIYLLRVKINALIWKKKFF